MLERIRIQNFKLLRDVELDLPLEVPTVLIGPNSSGKSTVIEVLDFLARAANDGLEAAVVAHGGMAAIRTAGTTHPIEITTNWNFLDLDTHRIWSVEWSLQLESRPGGNFYVGPETLRNGDTYLLTTSAPGERTVVDETDGKRRSLPTDKHRMLAFEVFADPGRHETLLNLKHVVQAIRAIGAIVTAPPWARASTDRASPRDSMVISPQQFVGKEGIGLANALYNLQTDHASSWQDLERAFRAEFPSIKRVVFPPDPGGSRISFALEDERFPGRRIYASEMSDGMVIYLCLLSLILHPQQRAVLALDEPDAHLHPSALRRLMSLTQQKHNDRRLLIVTHSNALLDELQDPAASIRIVESTPDGARIRKLDPAALNSWREDYSLSELRRTGLLDPSNTSYESKA
jgi:predicted ATPase